MPDPRLDKLAAIGKSAQIIPTRLTFVDIAGLVRGASKGEGLGNQFLANIREVDAIAHVVRCFEDGDITHVEGQHRSDRRHRDRRDRADAGRPRQPGEARRQRWRRRRKRRRQGSQGDSSTSCSRALVLLREGKPARIVERKPEEETRLPACSAADREARALCLQRRGRLRPRPATPFRTGRRARAKEEGAVAVVISAKIEAEIAELSREERAEYLGDARPRGAGLDRLIRAGYELLDLVTYFTVGPKEARAWTITAGTKAPQAAGVIHTDFEKGFIRAETIAYDDYVALGGEAGATRCRQAAAGRQGIRRRGRRRDAFPVQYLRLAFTSSEERRRRVHPQLVAAMDCCASLAMTN